MTTEFTTVVTDRSFLEGPRWHDGRIWVSDVFGHEVLSANEDGSDLRVEAVVNQPCGLGWLPDGRLLVASIMDRTLLRREANGDLVTHADLTPFTEYPINDMAVDGQGSAYVGYLGFDFISGAAAVATGGLLRVDPDGTVTRAAEDLWFPNGMVITGDDVLIVNESFGNRITAFDITANGTLVNRREWARFGDAPDPTRLDIETVFGDTVLASDGSTLDSEGAVWVADALNGRVVRLFEGGAISEQMEPNTGVFACALGGSDGKVLFLCIAPDADAEARKKHTEASLVSIRVGVAAPGN